MKEDNEPGIGARFQEETKYTRDSIGDHFLDWDAFPEPFKNYGQVIRIVPLPRPEPSGTESLWRLLQERRSRREYKEQSFLTMKDLALLLWATQGVTYRYGDTFFRTTPSAGGLYPVETYLSVRAAQDVAPGIYHFRPERFDLEYIKEGDFSGQLGMAALGQEVVSDAQTTFIWSAVIARGRWKYRQRAYRYVYLDAGHIAQNLYLAGEALGVGVCAIGAFFDDEVNRIIGLDGTEETVIYMGTVGIP
jgi:SagB-type dehydrogenase family enzyme